MRKAFLLISILLVAVGCSKTQQPTQLTEPSVQAGQSSIKVVESPYSASVDAATSSSDNSGTVEAEKYVDGLIKQEEQYNNEFLKSDIANYSGLPLPKEDNNVIESYSLMLKSSSGNYVMYKLSRLSKSLEELNDFAGELGQIGADFYMCDTRTHFCELSDIVKQAEGKQIVGYMEGLGYCIGGWNAEAKRIFSYRCGEGGDGAGFTEFDYGNNKVNKAVDQNAQFLAMNKTLTLFALVHIDQVNNYTVQDSKLEIYSVDHMEKPVIEKDLAKLIIDEGISRGNDILLSDGMWQDDNNFEFKLLNHNFKLNLNSGNINKIN